MFKYGKQIYLAACWQYWWGRRATSCLHVLSPVWHSSSKLQPVQSWWALAAQVKAYQRPGLPRLSVDVSQQLNGLCKVPSWLLFRGHEATAARLAACVLPLLLRMHS
jgi:hypothetical protein